MEGNDTNFARRELLPEGAGYVIAVALGVGVVAQILARHLRIPGIVVLLGTGVLLGPEFAGIVEPDELGKALQTLVGFAVAIILFEGGLALDFQRLRREATAIRRLVTIGAVITAVGGTVAAHYIMGWGWRQAALFGTLVIVTGPTVITPLLRRIKVQKSVSTVLKAEGVLIDPIGAIIAVVALEIAITGTSGDSLAHATIDLVSRLGFGILAGAVGGVALGLALRFRRLIHEDMRNILLLGSALVMFSVSNGIFHESGIMTVTVAGFVVGNMTHLRSELQEFQEQLTTLFIGMLFVLLAADVGMQSVIDLGWLGLATVAALMFVVRPINVFLSTWGASVGWRERLFMSWLAPRGIVAAAVASLFAQDLASEGIAGGEELRAMVFLVIAVTVVVQGSLGGLVATLLGVRRKHNVGYIIVGANALGRAVARALQEGGEEIVLVDINPQLAHAAEREGLRVILGNANDERTLLRAEVDARRGAIGLTNSEGVNLLFARRARESYKVPETFVTLKTGRPGVQEPQVFEAGAHVLFGEPVDLDIWTHRLRRGNTEDEVWTYEGPTRRLMEAGQEGPPNSQLLPMVVRRGRRVFPVDNTVRFRSGDRLHLLIYNEAREQVTAWLAQNGWSIADEEPATDESSEAAETSVPATA